MSFEITEAFVNSFNAMMTLRAQQELPRIRPYVRTESGIVGTSESYDFVGKRRPTKRASRHAPTVRNDTQHDRRWVDIEVYDDSDLIDKPDQVRTLTDPTNVYSQGMAAGFARLIDEICLDGALGITRTGQGGATNSAAPTNTIAQTGQGLTVNKITEALYRLNANEIDSDRHIAYTAQQERDMFGIEEVRSIDYNTSRVLASGEIRDYGGFMFHRVEDPVLKLTAVALERRCVAWTPPCVLLGIGADVTASIDRLPTMNNSTQIFYSADFGGARLEDLGVIPILCLETA